MAVYNSFVYVSYFSLRNRGTIQNSHTVHVLFECSAIEIHCTNFRFNHPEANVQTNPLESVFILHTALIVTENVICMECLIDTSKQWEAYLHLPQERIINHLRLGHQTLILALISIIQQLVCRFEVVILPAGEAIMARKPEFVLSNKQKKRGNAISPHIRVCLLPGWYSNTLWCVWLSPKVNRWRSHQPNLTWHLHPQEFLEGVGWCSTLTFPQTVLLCCDVVSAFLLLLLLYSYSAFYSSVRFH